MWRLKLKAGALQLTLYIIIVIALILTGFILLVHTHKQFNLQSELSIETVQNADKGLRYGLKENVALRDTTTINLNDESYRSLKLYRDYWGVFETLTTVSTIKKQSFKKVALMGGYETKTNKTALYVAENNKPLVLVGNSKIEGTSYLPKQGIKPGTIAGQFYNGSQLIYGQQRLSNALPQLPTELLTELQDLPNIYKQAKAEQFINLQMGKRYTNSFLKAPLMVYTNQPINLIDIELTGHIIIQSKTKITVHPSSRLTDVILIAPEIEVKTNTKGQFQAIASNQINIEQNVQLTYPSALILNQPKNSTPSESTSPQFVNSKITIDDDSIIKGLVIFNGQSNPNNYEVQVEVKDKATIIGELYCNQNTELKGSVYGTVWTNNFIAKQAGSVYQNHIFNGRIKRKELHQNYVGLTLENSAKGLVKWMY